MSADDTTKAMRAFIEAQILFLQGQLADLTAGDDEDEPVAPVKRGPGRPRKDGSAPVPRKAAKAAAKKVAPEPEPEDDEDETEDADEARRAELSAMKITTLRNMALKLGFKEEGVKAATKDELVDAIVNDENSSDEEDEDEADDVEYSREDIISMGIRKAKALAKEKGIDAADLRGVSLEEVADLILGEDAEEDDDEEGGDYYTRAQLEKMSIAELKAIGRQYEKDYPGWEMPKGPVGKPALIEALLDDGEDDEE